MKQYLYSIVVISVISALCRALCPDSATLRKCFSFLTSAALLCATVSPVASLVKGLAAEFSETSGQGTSVDYASIWLDGVSEITEEESESAIRSHLSEKLGVSPDCLLVSCQLERDGEGLRLGSIEITLFGAALLKNPRTIESYVVETFGVPCKTYDGGVSVSE